MHFPYVFFFAKVVTEFQNPVLYSTVIILCCIYMEKKLLLKHPPNHNNILHSYDALQFNTLIFSVFKFPITFTPLPPQNLLITS